MHQHSLLSRGILLGFVATQGQNLHAPTIRHGYPEYLYNELVLVGENMDLVLLCTCSTINVIAIECCTAKFTPNVVRLTSHQYITANVTNTVRLTSRQFYPGNITPMYNVYDHSTINIAPIKNG